MHRQPVARWLRDMLPKKGMNCGATRHLTYHHIVPVILGGNEVPSNIAVLCDSCHSLIHYGKAGEISHGELVKAGIKRANARGIRSGKKPADAEKTMRLIVEYSTQFNPESMTTEPEIMALAGVKPTTYAKYKRQLIALLREERWPYSWKKPRMIRKRPEYEGVLLRIRGEKP